jgi:hypothetical protein
LTAPILDNLKSGMARASQIGAAAGAESWRGKSDDFPRDQIIDLSGWVDF